MAALGMILLLVGGTIMGCGNSSGESSDSEENVEKGPFRVATSPTSIPMSYKDDEGNLTGFEHDVIEEIGKRIGREVEWTTVEGTDNLFGALDAGRVDTIAFQISVNEERKENYNFTDTYGHNEIYLAVRDDFKYDTLEDLEGKVVSVNPSHSLYPVIEEYNKDLPDDRKIQTIATDNTTKYEDLELGRFDAFPVTKIGYNTTMEKKDYKVKIGGKALVVEENAYPFAKDGDQALFEEVNTAIKDMLDDGTLAEISEEYYKMDVTKVSE